MSPDRLEKKRRANAAWYRKNADRLKAKATAYRVANPEKARVAKQAAYAKNLAHYNAKSREWRRANPEKARAITAKYKATHPAKAKARHKKYYADNAEKERARKQAQYAAHPEKQYTLVARRRARLNGAVVNDFSHAQWQEIQEHFNHCCVYCGKRAKGHLTQDHIIPLSKGGNHTASNVVPACKPCNSQKGTGAPLIPVQPLLLTIAPSKKDRVA